MPIFESDLTNMTDYTFHPQYVDPFYLQLMNMNFLRTDVELDAEQLFRDLLALSERV